MSAPEILTPERFAQLVLDYADGRAGALTPLGLPYPLPTEPVAQGAAAIQALATALDRLTVHNIAKVDAAAMNAAYPEGLSYFQTASTDLGWPSAFTGGVLTLRLGGYTWQWWSRLSTSTPELWWRTMGATTLSPWHQIAGQSYRIHNQADTVAINAGAWSTFGIKTLEQTAGSDITASGNGFAIGRDGLYDVKLVVTWGGGSANAVVTMGIGIGAAPASWHRMAMTVGTSAAVFNGAWDIPLSKGDAISAYLTHNSTGPGQVTSRRMSVRRVGN